MEFRNYVHPSITILLLFLSLAGCMENGIKEKADTDKLPAPVGAYSQALIQGNVMFLSGQIGINPESNEIVSGGIEAQTRQIMDNIKNALEDNDYLISDIVQCQVYMTDLNDYEAMNKIYSSYFEDIYPTRSVVQVEALPKGALIEIVAIAIR